VNAEKTCTYCGIEIMPQDVVVPDECGDDGEVMHIGCAALYADGIDIDMDTWDN